jgi:hypothetical protein
MAMQQTIRGVFVGLSETAYDAFETDRGEKVQGGVTYRAAIAHANAGGLPEIVKVSADQATALKLEGFGAQVELECSLFAKRNRIEASCKVLDFVGAPYVAPSDSDVAS